MAGEYVRPISEAQWETYTCLPILLPIWACVKYLLAFLPLGINIPVILLLEAGKGFL